MDITGNMLSLERSNVRRATGLNVLEHSVPTARLHTRPIGPIALPLGSGTGEILLGSVVTKVAQSAFLGSVETGVPSRIFLGSVTTDRDISDNPLPDIDGPNVIPGWYANVALPDNERSDFDIYNVCKGTLHIVSDIAATETFSIEREASNAASISLYGKREIELIQLTAVDTGYDPGRTYYPDTSRIDALLEEKLGELIYAPHIYSITIVGSTDNYEQMILSMRVGDTVRYVSQVYGITFLLTINHIDYSITDTGIVTATLTVSERL